MSLAPGGLFGDFAGAALSAVFGWVRAGVAAALVEVAHVIGAVTAPDLTSVWFTASYWRMTEIASLLTVPFLFAAAIQAVLRTDLALLGRAAFVHLPIALIAVSIACPIVMLLLAATDQMSAFVAGGSIDEASRFLLRVAGVTAIGSATVAPALDVTIGMFTITAAIALTVELLIREAAVYVVVLMLPLAFAALVWPARRIWATRMIELLIALILSKFVIVSILTLAGNAFGSTLVGVSQQLAAAALLAMACFAPWGLLKLLPFTELHAHATEGLRREADRSLVAPARSAGQGFADIAAALPAEMASRAAAEGQAAGGDAPDIAAEPTARPGSGSAPGGPSAADGAESSEPSGPGAEAADGWYASMVATGGAGAGPGSTTAQPTGPARPQLGPGGDAAADAEDAAASAEPPPEPPPSWQPTIEFPHLGDLGSNWVNGTDTDGDRLDSIDAPDEGPAA